MISVLGFWALLAMHINEAINSFRPASGLFVFDWPFILDVFTPGLV